MVRKLMKEKQKDNLKLVFKLRKQRDKARAKLETTWGRNARKLRSLVQNVKAYTGPLTARLQKKNQKKARFLVKKYGSVTKYEAWESMTKYEKEQYGKARIFAKNCERTCSGMQGRGNTGVVRG